MPDSLLRPLSSTGSLELFSDAGFSPAGDTPPAAPIALGAGAVLLPGWAAPGAAPESDVPHGAGAEPRRAVGG